MFSQPKYEPSNEKQGRKQEKSPLNKLIQPEVEKLMRYTQNLQSFIASSDLSDDDNKQEFVFYLQKVWGKTNQVGGILGVDFGGKSSAQQNRQENDCLQYLQELGNTFKQILNQKASSEENLTEINQKLQSFKDEQKANVFQKFDDLKTQLTQTFQSQLDALGLDLKKIQDLVESQSQLSKKELVNTKHELRQEFKESIGESCQELKLELHATKEALKVQSEKKIEDLRKLLKQEDQRLQETSEKQHSTLRQEFKQRLQALENEKKIQVEAFAKTVEDIKSIIKTTSENCDENSSMVKALIQDFKTHLNNSYEYSLKSFNGEGEETSEIDLTSSLKSKNQATSNSEVGSPKTSQKKNLLIDLLQQQIRLKQETEVKFTEHQRLILENQIEISTIMEGMRFFGEHRLAQMIGFDPDLPLIYPEKKSYSTLALKSETSYLGTKWEGGFTLVDSGDLLYNDSNASSKSKVFISYSLLFSDIIIYSSPYLDKFDDCIYAGGVYFLYEAETGILIKRINSEEPTLWSKIKLFDGYTGREMRACLNGSALALNKLKSEIIIMTISQDLEPGPNPLSLPNPEDVEIIDHNSFGAVKDWVAALSKKGDILIYQINQDGNKVNEFIHQKVTPKFENETFLSLAICPKSFLFCIVGIQETKSSSLSLLEWRDHGLFEKNWIEIKQFQFLYGLNVYGYIEDNLVLCAVSEKDECEVATFIYCDKGDDFYEVKNLRRFVDEEKPYKLVKFGDALFFSGFSGRVMRIKYKLRQFTSSIVGAGEFKNLEDN